MSVPLTTKIFAASLTMPDRLVLSAFFLFATALGAYVYIPLPFTPVPVTAQTFFVLWGAAWLGPRWGVGVQCAYLAMGAAGAPLFAGGALGAASLSGVTAGYLWGFVPASLAVAALAPRFKSLGGLFALMVASSAIILALGAGWLAFVLHLSWKQAVIMGVAPFIVGDLVKCLAAAGLARRRIGSSQQS